MYLGDIWPQQSRDHGSWRLTGHTEEGDQPLYSERQAVGHPAAALFTPDTEPFEQLHPRNLSWVHVKPPSGSSRPTQRTEVRVSAVLQGSWRGLIRVNRVRCRTGKILEPPTDGIHDGTRRGRDSERDLTAALGAARGVDCAYSTPEFVSALLNPHADAQRCAPVVIQGPHSIDRSRT